MFQTDRSRVRFVLLFGCGLLSLFGCNVAQFSGAGALGVLTMAFVAAYRWGEEEKVSTILSIFKLVWKKSKKKCLFLKRLYKTLNK